MTILTTALEQPLFSLLLTLISFQIGVWSYARCHNHALAHPVLIGSLVITVVLALLPITYERYRDHNALITFFLGPVVVALGVPLAREIKKLKGITLPSLLVVIIGSLLAPILSIICAWVLGADEAVLRSLIAKSVTSPIAINITESVGGVVALTTGVTVFTGVIGALVGPAIFRLVGLQDDRLQGLILGVNAHGVGTAKAFEISATCGALSGLAMGLTGAFSAFVLPMLVRLFL
ncbi:LrgB family protein [Marinibactrum halimedae]|uniref:LrgB family protein n=1 Tax=Marinibactrum halimedae TaxID=1444977 RepID=A0AA37WPD3_9GAMM|nr:LrgB family protein [Marinibactrum halimedae]MCD9458246.1 LrgB family protein [Marinibactrum halimedae]GLS27126.1 hypothetical protein GCM10007877_28450 [Marinibactrum halimedae]